jgi:hypothetical protein
VRSHRLSPATAARALRSRRLSSAILGTALALAPALTLAHEAAPTLAGVPTPPAPPGDGRTAEAIVREAVAATVTDEAAKKIIEAPVRDARAALERAHGARTSGDVTHARLLDGLALEFAETARDLLRAAHAEATSMAATTRAGELAAKVERTRVLLGELQARRGRAVAELERAVADAKVAATAAALAEEQRLHSVGKGRGAKPAAAKKKASR